MSAHSYGLGDLKMFFRAAIAVFPVFFLSIIAPCYIWSSISLYQYGFTYLGFVVNQVGLILAVGTFFLLQSGITYYTNDAMKKQHEFGGWRARHEEFHYSRNPSATF